MGTADSKQKLGEKVTSARKKLEENSKIYSQRSNEFVTKSAKMSQYMIEIISKSFEYCSPFAEPTLLTAWYSNPSKCEEIVLNSCKKILNAPIVAEEWDWFQKYVFPSTIWMLKSTQNRNQFMYEKLLEIANSYSNNIMNSMDLIYDSLQHQKGWKELMEIKNATFISRQDHKQVGLLKEGAISDIVEAKSNQDYEMQSFLDSNWCVNSLLSTATMLNSEFQNHIKTVISHYGEFKPGPLKKIDRCQSKMENDYSECVFPKAAKLLDIVRCSVTFNTIDQLMNGYNGLMRHIKNNKSMLQLARVKNGFINKQHKGYRDVKVNVVYQSPVSGVSMVCEVQLLLVNYLWEKKRIHKLYNIVRQELYFQLVVTEEQKSDQKQKDPKDLKLVPVFKFSEKIAKSKTLKNDVLFKCSVDPELNLLSVRSSKWFGCVSLDTSEVIFEQAVKECGRFHSHHWIKVGGKKYLTMQTDPNIIKMYKVENNAFAEDKKLEINVGVSKTINLIEYDKNYENAFLIVDSDVLEQRSTSDTGNVVMSIKLQEKIGSASLKQLCLADNGESCVIGGGNGKKHFYFIDLKTEKQHKLTSTVLGATFAPCFLNGDAKYVAVGDGGWSASKIEIWDITTKQSFKVIDGFSSWISCTMSTNNILAAAASDKKIKLWDTTTWDVFYEEQLDFQPFSLHLTSDARYLTIGGQYNSKCVVWKIE